MSMQGREVQGSQLRYGLQHGPWSVYASATRQRSRNTSQDNKAFIGIPRHSGALRTAYDWQALPLTTWWQLAWVGERYANADNTLKVSGYQRHDIGLQLEHGTTRYHLRVRNLFDKQYIAALSSPNALYPGQGRQLWARVVVAF